MFLATQCFGRIEAIKIVQNCAILNSGELVQEVGAIISVTKLYLACWVETKAERENWV